MTVRVVPILIVRIVRTLDRPIDIVAEVVSIVDETQGFELNVQTSDLCFFTMEVPAGGILVVVAGVVNDRASQPDNLL